MIQRRGDRSLRGRLASGVRAVSHDDHNSDHVDQILRLWVAHQQQIFRYVFALLPHTADAQEVLQSTCVALWHKSAAIDLDRPFLPLAYQFALFEVRKHREKHRRRPDLLDDSALEVIAAERSSADDLFELRRRALDDCVANLPPEDRELVANHYERQLTMPEIARRSGRNIHTLYKSIQRIRRQLIMCINGAVARAGDS